MPEQDDDAGRATNPWAAPDSTPVPPAPAGQPPHGQPPYPLPPYAQQPYPPPAYGQQLYGQQPYAQPGPYGPPQAYAPQPQWGQPPPWGAAPYGQQPWGYPAPPDPAARKRSRTKAVVALASVVVLLLVGLGASLAFDSGREERVQAEVVALLPELQAFVEQERGLPFKEDVAVEVLDDDAFLEALYEEDHDAPEPREDADVERTLNALGLLDPDVDLDEAVGESLDEGVVGFYDPANGRLAVRGRDVDAFVQLVLVHELTHALQDQHFEIDRPELDEADDERSVGFLSLVEGDAVRVETAWLQAQPPSVQEELAELFESGAPGGGEPVVEQLLGFPYYAGPDLVQSLLDTGGQAALDAAFREPPTTVEQVVDPGAGPGTTPQAPEADGDVLDQGVLGVLTLSLLLENDPLGDGPESAWNGDRYLTFEDGDRTCTLAEIAVDDPASGQVLLEELQDWAAAQDDAQVSEDAGGSLQLEACTG